MLDAVLWDYDGTLADTMVKNLAVTRAVFQRLDPALLNPPPGALSSLEAYRAANYRWKNWRELYAHACGVPEARLDEAGRLWAPCQQADETLPPLFGGLKEVLRQLRGIPMGICSQNSADNIRAALARHGVGECFAAVVGNDDVPYSAQKPNPAAFLLCLERLGLTGGQFVYIGDHPGDVAFGRAAERVLRERGVQAAVTCVAVQWEAAAEPGFSIPPDAVARTPAELAELLRELGET